MFNLCLEFDFILCPEVKEKLKLYHMVFKIEPGWHNGYEGCHCHTIIPVLLQLLSGDAVPSSHLTVSLTSQTKGARPLNEIIAEKFLTAHVLSKKRTYCMVTKAEVGKEGGESIGMILSVTTSTKKKTNVFL